MSVGAHPKRAAAFSYPLPLVDPTTGNWTSTPTLVAGDVKVSKDFGALANITSLPAYANGMLLVVLSAAEMTADNVTVKVIDQTATKEWRDTGFTVYTEAQTFAEILAAAQAALNIAQGDRVIDDSNPAQFYFEVYLKGTATLLVRKKLLKLDGTPVIAENDITANMIEP